MRPTGIVRRVDDLGRVVIPKEIRRTLGIKEGEPLEIYTDEDNIKSIVDTFEEIQILNKKLNNAILDLQNKNEQIMKEIKENDKKIAELRKNTVQLRKIIETFLTKNLKRKINIMGDEYLFAK
jgi:AbrB family looped-hinge helix DNA binding protein